MATYEQLMDAARKADAAGDAPATKRFLELAKGAKSGPQTNIVEQVGTGTSEGIANMAGLPVDMLTKGINAVGGMAGMPPIQTPVGGSESLKGLLSPFMADAEPQTAGQRIGRRVGQDVGSGAVAAPLAGISSLGGLAMNAGADVASGAAGGATSEVTDNPVVNALVSLLAGAAVPGAAYAMRGDGSPSIDDLKGQASARYKQVEDSDLRLTPDQTQEMQGNISARMNDEFMDPPMHPNAAGGVRRVYGVADRSPDGQPTLQEVREATRWITQHVQKNVNAAEGEQALGGAMKSEIKDYLGKVAPDHPDVQAWREADALTRRAKNAGALDEAMENASVNAGSSGVGGNTINASRQAVKNALLKGKQAQYLNPAEEAAVKQFVKGTKTSNALRRAGGFAPARGMFPSAGLIAQASIAGATGNPLFVAPAVIGSVAQALGESLTKRQVNDLSTFLKTGAKPNRAMSAGEIAVLNALLASQAAQHSPQSGPQ
jgi:hypothetical protein